MKIRMLVTAPGADDGFTVLTYEAGKEYDVSDMLAKEFVGAKQAEIVEESAAAKPSRKRK